jgi:hypothetical protein
MSMRFGYRPDPWGGEFEELFAPVWAEAAVDTAHPQRLWEVIPNDPDYRKYIPIDYRLDATQLVGGLAEDLQHGQSAHVWVELADWGITGTEIFELISATSALALGMSLASPLLGLVASFLAIGAGYQEASAEIAKDSSASGYSRGAVMGADGRPSSLVREYFGNLVFTNTFYQEGANVAKASHDAGLVTGYLHGRALRQNQRTIFWHDLGYRMGDQSYRGPPSQWSSQDWSFWYTDAAGYFRRYHLTA